MDIRCSKCKGLLVSDMFLDDSSYWLSGMRCVNCGSVKLDEKVISNAYKETNRRVDRMDELELYRTRSRGVKRYRNSVQHKQVLE